MKKYLLFVFGLVLAVLMFSGCSGSDGDGFSADKVFIGAWKSSLTSKFSSLYFMPGGKLKYGYRTKEQLKGWTYSETSGMYYLNGNIGIVEYDPSSNGHWIYDTNTQTMSMYSDNGNETYRYKVTLAGDYQSWVGVDSKGNSVSFIKIEE